MSGVMGFTDVNNPTTLPDPMPILSVSTLRVKTSARLCSIFVLAMSAILSIGCEKPDRVELSESRKRFVGEQDPEFGLTARQRFLKASDGAMAEGETAGNPDTPPKNPFQWIVPEGWSENESSRMRLINLSFGPNGEGECYLTALPGEGGGIPPNVNRWRGQMGFDALTEEQINELPEQTLLGMPAKLVDIRGDFGGMSIPGAPPAEKKSDYRLLGLIQQQPPFTFFVKMTGPADVVAANEAAFYTFCQSITIGAH